MLGFTTGASFSDESMSLAALIMSTNEITLNSFPSQETIREYSAQQGFMQSNDEAFQEEVAQATEYLSGVKR